MSGEITSVRDSLPDISIREATLADIPEILRHRRRMYEDMRYSDDATLARMQQVTEPYLRATMAGGSFRGWLACAGDRIVAGAAVVIVQWPAHTYDLECRRATILNVYTEPEFRRRGIARLLMRTLIDCCRQEGFARVFLHSSDDGRPLYQSLGFEPGNEMILKLR
jgi:GNAT superfamily N-acetyltransferase